MRSSLRPQGAVSTPLWNIRAKRVNRKLCFRHRNISGLTQAALCTALPIKGNSEVMERSGMEEDLPGRVNDLTLNDFI